MPRNERKMNFIWFLHILCTSRIHWCIGKCQNGRIYQKFHKVRVRLPIHGTFNQQHTYHLKAYMWMSWHTKNCIPTKPFYILFFNKRRTDLIFFWRFLLFLYRTWYFVLIENRSTNIQFLQIVAVIILIILILDDG